MKRLLVFSFLLISFFLLADEPEMKDAPCIQMGQTVIITYPVSQNPAEALENMTVLLKARLLDKPVQISMTRQEKLWVADYVLQDTLVKSLYYYFQGELGDSLVYDTGDDLYWDMLVCDSTGRPVRGAHFSRALSFTGMSGQRPENLANALDALKEELTLYPDNYQALSLKYTLLMRKEVGSRSIKRSIRRELEEQEATRANDTQWLRLASSVYRMIGEEKKASDTEEQLIARDPQSDRAAVRELSAILEMKDPAAKNEKLSEFVMKYPESRFIEAALAQQVSVLIELDRPQSLREVGDKLERRSVTPAGASGLAAIAGIFAETGTETVRAMNYINKAIEIIMQAESIRPPEISANEWSRQIDLTAARYREIKGRLLGQMDEWAESIEVLEEAALFISQSSLYYHLGQAYRQTGDLDQAMVNYARAALFEDEIAEKALQALNITVALDGRFASSAPLLEKQKAWLESTETRRVIQNRINKPAPDFTLDDMNGYEITLSEQREAGPVVLCFWASWSRASRQVIGLLEELARDWGHEVLFMTISTDTERNDILKFQRATDMTLPVLLNDGTDVAYGLNGVPAVYIIDALGNIQYEHRGYHPDFKWIFELQIKQVIQGK